MTDTTIGMQFDHTPARPCGSCSVCCSALGIDELQKKAGPPCVHLRKPQFGDQHRCTIYDRRPIACSRFYCAWAFGLGPTNNGRPDRSGLMIVIYPPDPDEDRPLSAVISIVDDRRCGPLDDETSLIRQFITHLLELGLTRITIINRTTGGVLYLADGLMRAGKLRPQKSYEDLSFDLVDGPPVGAVLMEKRNAQ